MGRSFRRAKRTKKIYPENGNQTTKIETTIKIIIFMVTTKVNAVRNFIYFSLNFPSNFIEKCWADQPEDIENISSKFYQAYKTVGAVGAMTRFMSELDEGNQIKLVEWVNENYVGFSKFHL